MQRDGVKVLMVLRYICLGMFIPIILLQTGCWDMKLYEEIGFIMQFGLEYDKDENLLISMTSPVVSPDAKESAEILHTTSETLVRGSRELLRNKAGKMLQGGKVQHIFFSEDMARKEGVYQYIEVFIRNPENPMLANVAIVKGSPKEMMELNLEYTNKPRPAYYMADLLRDAHRRAAAPETRIYRMSILYHSGTIDPVLPYIRYDDKDIEIIGSAIMDGDKMVGEIDVKQTMLLNALMGMNKHFEYIYDGKTPNENEKVIKQGIAARVRDSDRRIRINTEGETPVIGISLKLTALVDEYSGENRLIINEEKRKLEETVSKDIEKQILDLLRYLQSAGSDPVGFGEMVRAYHNKYWKSVDWGEVYGDVEFRADVKLNFEIYGAIE